MSAVTLGGANFGGIGREKERKKHLRLLQRELPGAGLRVCIPVGCPAAPAARRETYVAWLCLRRQKHAADSSEASKEQMALKSAQEERKEQPQGSAPRVPPDAHLSPFKRLWLTEGRGGMAMQGCSASLALLPFLGSLPPGG